MAAKTDEGHLSPAVIEGEMRPILVGVMVSIVLISLIAWNITWMRLTFTSPEFDLIDNAEARINLESTNITVELTDELGLDQWSKSVEFQNDGCGGTSNQAFRCQERKDASFAAHAALATTIVTAGLVLFGTWPRRFQTPAEFRFLRFIPSVTIITSGIVWLLMMFGGSESVRLESDLIGAFKDLPALPETMPIETSVFFLGPTLTILTGLATIAALHFGDRIQRTG